MNILYFSFVELDIPNACQTHTLGVLNGFSHHGCRVDALIPRPIYVRAEIPNVRFFYLWPWQFSRLGQMWVKCFSALLMFSLCLRNKYDAIYVREMEANLGPRLCSSMFRIPLYMEINDLSVLILSESGASRRLLEKVKRNQNLDFHQATGLIVPSVPMCKWIRSEYSLSRNKVHMILNGADISKVNQSNKNIARKRLGLSPACLCIGFVGTIYKGYDFLSILKAIIKCRKEIPELYLVIIGGGPMKDDIQKHVNELALEKRVIFTGFIQPEELSGILAAIDIGLLLRTKEGAMRYGPVSTKLATYAIQYLPVITAGYSLEGYPWELIQGLFLIRPEDHEALSDMIMWVYHHPRERKEKGKILHEFAREKLTWNYVTKEILDIMKNDEKLVASG